jgi:Helix-turn-helix
VREAVVAFGDDTNLATLPDHQAPRATTPGRGPNHDLKGYVHRERRFLKIVDRARHLRDGEWPAVVVVHALTKKTQKIPAQGRLRNRWVREPGFKAGYDALEAEFTLASMLIEARTKAHLSQVDVAERMGTSQSTIARLESGAAKPTLSTLERWVALDQP